MNALALVATPSTQNAEPNKNCLKICQPLCAAQYSGSFRIRLVHNALSSEGRLYRLTRQGCGYVFAASESALGNPHVPRIIKDFGPVLPSDEYGFSDPFILKNGFDNCLAEA